LLPDFIGRHISKARSSTDWPGKSRIPARAALALRGDIGSYSGFGVAPTALIEFSVMVVFGRPVAALILAKLKPD
jgi:hypothetical protein